MSGMRFSLLTYNTLYSRATKHIIPLIKKEKPDVVCLQELEISQESFETLEKADYKLANFSNSFIKFGRVFGVGTFYNPQRLTVSKTEFFNMPRSIWELLLVIIKGGNKPRTTTITEFSDEHHHNKIIVYNLHLSPWASTGLRLKQIKKTLGDLNFKKEAKIIIAGDFNLPYERKRLERILKEYSLKEATDNIFFSFTNKILKLLSLKLKNDYILYKNIKNIKTRRLNVRFSDHYPIIAEFEIKNTA